LSNNPYDGSSAAVAVIVTLAWFKRQMPQRWLLEEAGARATESANG
jgi:hypothetical protein